MTTPTRPLPPGVEIQRLDTEWFPSHRQGDGSYVYMNNRGQWGPFASSVLGAGGWTTDLAAEAAFWARHDAQPENQPKGEVPSLLGPTHNESVLLEMIVSLTARVAAMEAKAQPKPSPGPRIIEGMNQLRTAVQNGTLDQLPTTVVARCGDRTVRYTREPEAAPPPSPSTEVQHREPVVGMLYMTKGSTHPCFYRIDEHGNTRSAHWKDCVYTVQGLTDLIRSGHVIPVPGYKVEVTP